MIVPAGAMAGARQWPRRATAVGALLAVEYLVLTLLVDLAALGEAQQLVALARVLSPAVVGGLAAGILLARHAPAQAVDRAVEGGGAHHPWAALAVQLAAFAATAYAGHRLLGRGAPPAAAGAFLAWAAAVAATVVLAGGIVVPLPALARAAVRHGRIPLLAATVGLLAWRAVLTAEETWGALRGRTLAAVAALLRAVASDVVFVPAESAVGVGRFEVEIAPMCSGVEGLGLVLVFQILWLSLARRRIHFGRALLLLLPLGAAASLAANVVRIAALVLLGGRGHAELAMGAFHSKLGWLLFAGVALASVALADRLPWLRRSAPAETGAGTADVGLPPAAAAYVAPLLATLTAALVTGLWAHGGFDPAYGVRVVAGAAALLVARRSLPRGAPSFSGVALVLGAAVCALWLVGAGAARVPMPADLAALGTGERAGWIALRLAGACLVLPAVEELAFRGFLLGWLASRDGAELASRGWSWPAVLVSSVAFGALHEHVLLGTAAGIVFAAARLWRGRLGDAILAHAACNAGIAIAVLVGGRWALWM